MIQKEHLLKNELILANLLSEQKKQLWERISELKSRESDERSKCKCRGYCNINHGRKRWFPSKADILETQLKVFHNNLNLKCNYCDFATTSEEEFQIHWIANHNKQKHQVKRPLKSILKKKIG